MILVRSILGSRIWTSLSRIAGFPEWMQYHGTLALWPFLAVVGCGILISVPSNIDGTVQRRSWVLLLFSIATGALAGIVIGIRWKEEIIQTLPG